jgi:Protein of unknown function (DUF4232)
MKGTPVFAGASHANAGYSRNGLSRPGLSGSGRLALAVAALICGAAVGGCASSSSQPATPPTTATVTTTAPAAAGSASNSTPTSTLSPAVTGPPACPTSSLKVKQGVAQGYAGGVYEVIDFTNTSGSPCTLYGYPGVSLVSGPPYTQIGLPAKRGAASTPVKQVTLAPGATANAQLQIVDALNYPPASCGPTKATALKIYPPNQTVPVYLPSTSTGCGKSVQIMYIGPVQPGSGSSS